MITKAVGSRIRGAETENEFNFTYEMLPGGGDNSGANNFISNYRIKGWELFQQLSLPTTKEEAWRRTDLRGLKPSSLRLANAEDYNNFELPPSDLLKPLKGKKQGGQAILSTGGYIDLSVDELITSQGVIFTDWQTAINKHSDILSYSLGQIVRQNESKFTALVAAFSANGVLVYVPEGVAVEAPFHSVFWSPGANLAHLSNVLIWLEDGASLTYVHESASNNEPKGQSLNASTISIHLGESARLTFIELQALGEHIWNFSHERAKVGRNARLDWVYGAMGSKLTKSFLDIDLIGEGASARISGCYFTGRKQHIDLDTQQNHLVANTSSDLLFKGAVTDQSHSIWQGMIFVAPEAQKTDGYQANQNITLSSSARADSIPGLEILADDVRCTHGATVGKIDPDQIFYLQSRGIPAVEASHLLVDGFFEPIIQRVPYEDVRKRFQNLVHKKMD